MNRSDRRKAVLAVAVGLSATAGVAALATNADATTKAECQIHWTKACTKHFGTTTTVPSDTTVVVTTVPNSAPSTSLVPPVTPTVLPTVVTTTPQIEGTLVATL